MLSNKGQAFVSLALVLVTCDVGEPSQSEPEPPFPPGSSPAWTVECDAPRSEWVWCDDFEADRSDDYFEMVDDDGSFVHAGGVGLGGSNGMRARFARGQVSAGSLKLAFGRTPQRYFRPVDAGDVDYREIFWRFYVRNEPGWVGGGGDKLTRLTSFASENSWAQSMIAHLWSGSGGTGRDVLVADPASGVDPLTGLLVTTVYNDFDNLRWLGAVSGPTRLFASDNVGAWYCVEAHVRLDQPLLSDGVFEFWIDGAREVRIEGLAWVGLFGDYGLNAVFLENYWNAGSPADQERYLDNFVVSTERIGCVQRP